MALGTRLAFVLGVLMIPQLGQMAEAGASAASEKTSSRGVDAAIGVGSFQSSLTQAAQGMQSKSRSGSATAADHRGPQKTDSGPAQAPSELGAVAMAAAMQLVIAVPVPLPYLSTNVVQSEEGHETSDTSSTLAAGAGLAGVPSATKAATVCDDPASLAVPLVSKAAGAMLPVAVSMPQTLDVQPKQAAGPNAVSSMTSNAEGNDPQPSTNVAPANQHAALLSQVQDQLQRALHTSAAHAAVTVPVALVSTMDAKDSGRPVNASQQVANVAESIGKPAQETSFVPAAAGSERASTASATLPGILPVSPATSAVASAGRVVSSNGVMPAQTASAKTSVTRDASGVSTLASAVAGKHTASAQNSSTGQGADNTGASSQEGVPTGMPSRTLAGAASAAQVVASAPAIQSPAIPSSLPTPLLGVTPATPATTSSSAVTHDASISARSGAVAHDDPAPLSAIQSAQLVQRASQAEMRVNLHSQEFGAINIRTATAGQTISAQVSLEHGDLARALSAHMPEAQARTGVEHSVELRTSASTGGSAGMGSNEASGGQQKRSDQQPRDTATGGAAYGSRTESVAVSALPQVFTPNTTSVSTGRIDLRA